MQFGLCTYRRHKECPGFKYSDANKSSLSFCACECHDTKEETKPIQPALMESALYPIFG